MAKNHFDMGSEGFSSSAGDSSAAAYLMPAWMQRTTKSLYQRVEEAVFGTIFYMTDRTKGEKSFAGDTLIPLLVVFVDFFQLLSLVINNQHDDKNPWTAWIAYLAGPLPAIRSSGSPTFDVMYLLTAASILVCFTLTGWVAYMYKAQQLRVFWVKVLRFLVHLLVGALYIPIVELLCVPFEQLLNATSSHSPEQDLTHIPSAKPQPP
eukprot:CAMPEP_0184345546 /NCGR_PEP_ID=MMETSP1089-20130417/13943_1 /TAXON_ID=38269 ORGANISM="Gloeochaete wittrockiana, Strain SAG46.84" /NCGR_SAMPLE_ID=MMETSP1089 /ASSEMBLY_ACC=CAM_ASM_000445 /LENGTH=206 /DNA_ID=CAMNT_0026675887 /DNA_START=59 /DNA_END=675 /DNA_ORIENTATION=-